MAKKSVEVEEVITSQSVLGDYLSAKENAPFHLNSIVPVDYICSTGSLSFDIALGGGFCPGLHRFMGPPEAGKTSASLEVCRNFLKLPKRRGVYVNAEGRLNKNMIRRCGLRFVYKAEDWVDGTIFVVESNFYNFVIKLISKLVTENEEGILYCFIVDSMDALILEDDAAKTFDGNNKVAGAPLLTKKFLQRMANGMSKRGHLCLMMSQYSTNISLDEKYAAATDKRGKQGSGGWAVAHWTNFALELLEAQGDDIIKEVQDSPPGPKNAILGKRIKIRFKKSTNEKTHTTFSYPIRYGVVGGSSIWVVREVLDTLLSDGVRYGLVKKSGAWFNFSDEMRAELAPLCEEVPLKFQGAGQFFDWLDSQERVVKYLYDKLRDYLVIEAIPAATKQDEEETKEF